MGAQEKRILSNSPDTMIVDSRSTCNYDKSHGKYSLCHYFARRKTGEKTNPVKSDRSNPAKTATPAIDESWGAAYRSRVLCSCD